MRSFNFHALAFAVGADQHFLEVVGPQVIWRNLVQGRALLSTRAECR